MCFIPSDCVLAVWAGTITTLLILSERGSEEDGRVVRE